MADLTQRLMDLDKKITAAKNESIATKAKMDSILDRLKKEFNINSIDEAGTVLDTMDADISKMEVQRDKLIGELEKEVAEIEGRTS